MNRECQYRDRQNREHQNRASLENHIIPVSMSFTASMLSLPLWQFGTSNLADPTTPSSQSKHFYNMEVKQEGRHEPRQQPMYDMQTQTNSLLFWTIRLAVWEPEQCKSSKRRSAWKPQTTAVRRTLLKTTGLLSSHRRTVVWGAHWSVQWPQDAMHRTLFPCHLKEHFEAVNQKVTQKALCTIDTVLCFCTRNLSLIRLYNTNKLAQMLCLPLN